MSEISISGKTGVKGFYNAFIKEYPYLHAALKYPDGTAVDMDKSIANAKSKSMEGNYSPAESTDFSVRGNLKVESFEKRFKETFGITCSVHFKKNGKWVVTGPKYKSQTLSEANQQVKAEGGEEITLS